MRSLNPWPLFPAPLPPQAAASLSLQFLVQELISALRWLRDLELNPSQHEQFEWISSELEKFLLFSLELPLAQKGGFLDKLCFYMNILLQNSSTEEDIKILSHLQAMKSRVLQLKSNLSLFYKSNRNDSHFFFSKPQRCCSLQEAFMPQGSLIETWRELIQMMQSQLRLLFDSLFSFFQEFRHDENLLFLLIEQKEPLNQYLGHRAVETVLARLFPQGASSLRETLYNGYARRGFLDFYSRNEELIESIDWENACPLSNPKPKS